MGRPDHTATVIGRRLPSVVTVLAALAGTGCYTYQATSGTPPIGTDVRAVVTDEQALRVSEQTGQLSRTLDGRLVGASDDSVFVSVVTLRMPTEISGTRELRQSVGISREGLAEMATRELSMLRSGVLGALAGTGVYLVIRQVVAGGNVDDNPDDGNPIGTLVPIIRIPVGR